MNPSTKQIVLENNQVIPEIFGSQDLNLKLIEKKFNVRITTRENQISIKGKPASLESVENLFRQLEKLHAADQPVENGDVKFAIRLMAENPQADLKTILKHREIWLCAICIVCGYQLFYATYSFSAYLQQNFGLTAVAVGTITVAKLWMRPIGGITAGFIADWSNPEKVLSILLIAASLSLGIMAFLPTNSAVIAMILVVLLIGFLTYGVRGVYWATLAGCNIPNKSKGLAIGVISMIGYFPEFYLPLISAPLLEQYPGVLGYQIYYLIISGFGFIGAYAAYLLMQPRP